MFSQEDKSICICNYNKNNFDGAKVHGKKKTCEQKYSTK